MTSKFSRLLCAALALLLVLGTPLTALAGELPAAGGEEAARPLAITVPDYTPGPDAGAVENIQKGGLYTLIVLPRTTNSSAPPEFTAELLLNADPLFVGSAVAAENGKVTFTNIRLRTAEAAIYYVTGPGLDKPLAETTGLSVSVYGTITRNTSAPVENATVSLLDKATGYSYANSVRTDDSGFYSMENLSPGEYYLHVEKPGYLPATDTHALIVEDDAAFWQNFDISAFLGDVNGDAKRDLSDLTALLSCYGKPSGDIPAGLFPDLYDDGTQVINVSDAALLLNAMITYDKFPKGVGMPTSAAIDLRDDADAGQTNRALTFFLDNGGADGLTFTAANVTLTFRTDYIQPINQNGGAVNPANPNTAANCLVPKAGVTVSDAAWSQRGDFTTLTFSLTCAKPTALTELAELRYRPVSGKTANSFFEGVFAIDHAAAQVGEVTVLTKDSFTLEYPQSAAPELDSITIDQEDATLTIPTEGRTAVMALSATGHKDGEEDYPDLAGVTWALTESHSGVSIANSLLTVTHEAKAGELQIIASLGDKTSQPLTVTLKNAPSVPSRISIQNSEGTTLARDFLESPAGTALTASYQTQVFDQYSVAMPDQTVTWSLSGAPAGVSVSQDGVLAVADTLAAGTYTFSLHADLDSFNLRATAAITLTLEPELESLLLSGPASAQIPSGAEPLVLRYVLSALDAQGNAMSTSSLSPSFAVERVGDDSGQLTGVSANRDITDNFTVTVDAGAQPGEYTLRVTEGEITASFTLTLLPAQEDSASLPVQAALSYKGEIFDTLEFNFLHQHVSGSVEIKAVLLNRDGQPLEPKEQRWNMMLQDAPDGLSPVLSAEEGCLELYVEDSLPCGTHLFTVTAKEEITGLEVTAPVKLTLIPSLRNLTLHAPETLTIPTDGELRYPIAYTAIGTDDRAMSVSDLLTWRVADAENNWPAGITMKNNELVVAPSAKPGEITVTAIYELEADGIRDHLVAACTITLEPAGTEQILALMRDGELLTGGVDTAYGKEGTAVSMTYTPVLLDPITREITELSADEFTWIGVQGVFEVEAAAEPGIYTSPITAIYQGQSVSLTAQVTVYPDITGLYIQFDEGDTDAKDEQYRFPLPLQGSKNYYGTLMAKLNRGGKTVSVPLIELGLTDYDIEIYTNLTGVYTAYDRATGRFTLTIESVAGSNSMKNPDESKGEVEIRYLRFIFGYYPGQDEYDQRQLFILSRETSKVTTAVLRQGAGVGSKFVFETTRGDVTLQTAPGVLSYCYALELLDQYGNTVTSETVTWKLEGSPQNGSTNLITLVDPGKAVTDKHPLYQSIRRLRIAPETPEGEYHLTLTASAAGFSRSVQINLTVSGQQELASVILTGSSSELIPKWYAKYNSTTLNTETRTTSYVAVAQDKDGNELDASLCNFAWSVTTANGKTPAGVSIAADQKNPATATLTIDRKAQPTGSKESDLLRVIVTATPKAGSAPFTSEIRLALTRGALVPTLMTINGPGTLQMELDAPTKVEEYTFDLVNQYNDPVSERDAQTVTWTVSGSKPSFVTVNTKDKDKSGHPSATVTVKNPGYATRGTFTLTASIEFAEASTSSGRARVYASRTVTVTVGNPSAGGGGFAGGGGVDEPPAAANTTVTPPASKNGTTGTATLSADEVAILTAATAAGTLTIAPTGTTGLTTLTTTFPASLAKAIAEKAVNQSLCIKTTLGTVTLPRETLTRLGQQSGDVSITILNQTGVLSVTFRVGGAALSNLPGQILFQASVSGNTILNSQGEVIKKAVVTNGRFSAYLTGDAQFKLATLGKVFSDTQNSWAKDAVTFVTARDLFQGTSETTFDPNGNMTRGMLVTVLYRLEDLPASNAANLFEDVPNGTWYTNAVVWANDRGIVQGSGNGFLPNDPVSREQIATILYRYMEKLGFNTSKRTSLSSFSDNTRVSSWAKDAMEWAVATGLITGKTGGVLDPRGNATRAEVATILERLIRAMAPSV